LTPSKVQRLHGIPESSVRGICNAVVWQHHGQSKPRSGHPKKFSLRDERHVIRVVRLDPKIIYRNLLAKTGVNVSVKTVYRLLKEEGITNWIYQKRPLLTPEVAGKRYAWALAHENWGFDKWAKIIWSDECSVERGTGKRREWCFRTPAQKWNKNMIQPYKKGHDFSIMVWACFWGLEHSNLYALERDFEAKKQGYSARSYIHVLDDNLPGIYQPGLIFMQDKAPIHTAKAVALWFRENGINVMEWPPYSPDMNPIEHLWFLLKEHVDNVNPHINNVVGGEDKIKAALFDALYKAWEALDEYYLHDLVWSMERRVEALIASEGWYTKY
jgi:transposase